MNDDNGSDNDDNKVTNIFSKKKPKKEEETKIIDLSISYTDGSVEAEECHWFGESVEMPGLFMFGKDENQLPSAFINLEFVRRINLKERI